MRVNRSATRISAARVAAFDVLASVAEGAYASDALRERNSSLSSRDAGLAAQIVFGCLRYQAQLDHLIYVYSRRQAKDLDEAVRVALRAGIFQLRYLERVPPHAAVGESVEYVKSRARAAAGLVNAVLRKVTRATIEWPDLATELSCPGWLLERWSDHFGASTAQGIAKAILLEPVHYIRIAPGSPLPDGFELEPASVPGALRLLSPPSRDLRLHDVGSQAIVPLLELEPHDTYLDLCAAPGNKTLQALETRLALAVACDISARRIREVPPICPRIQLDAAAPLPFGTKFSKILVDAPCSGTGTLARNPEIKWRLQPDDLARFQKRQIAILCQAVQLVAPGGKLVYATCSLEREENEDVVEEVLKQQTRTRRTREFWRLPGRDEGDGFYAAVLEQV